MVFALISVVRDDGGNVQAKTAMLEHQAEGFDAVVVLGHFQNVEWLETAGTRCPHDDIGALGGGGRASPAYIQPLSGGMGEGPMEKVDAREQVYPDQEGIAPFWDPFSSE
ncbi:MAG: hypothetical protein ABIW76_11420 [Fibrobacteria bacterium]